MEANPAGVKPKSAVQDALRGLFVSEACRRLGKQKWKWFKAVLCSDLPLAARVVGLYLCDRIDDSGVTFPSRETIASDLHFNVKEVDRALKTLKARRFLASIRARRGQARNVYALCDPNIAGMVEDAFRVIKSAKGETDRAGSKRAETSGDVHSKEDVSVHFKRDGGVRFHLDDSGETIQREKSPSSSSESTPNKRPFVGDQRENVVPFPHRPAPSAPAAMPAGPWPFHPRCADDPLLDQLIPPGSEVDFRTILARDLFRYSSAEIRDSIGYDRDHDRPDHRWLPPQIGRSLTLLFKAGMLTRRSMLDELAPALANGELREAFDRARLARWKAEAARGVDTSNCRNDPRFRDWFKTRQSLRQ